MLRSASSYTNYGAEVAWDGSIFKTGYHTRIFCSAVVPVMHISIKDLEHLPNTL